MEGGTEGRREGREGGRKEGQTPCHGSVLKPKIHNRVSALPPQVEETLSLPHLSFLWLPPQGKFKKQTLLK